MSDHQDMLKRAQEIQHKSYSPYSKFKVGACLKSTDGKLFVGCNYENASYGLCLCAEGSAIAAMINAGYREIIELVVVGSSEEPCTPCGACRQRIREFAQPTIKIHMYGANEECLTKTLNELLPYSFGPEFL